MLSALDLMSEVKYFCPKADVVRPIVKIRKVSRFIVVLQLLVTFRDLALGGVKRRWRKVAVIGCATFHNFVPFKFNVYQ